MVNDDVFQCLASLKCKKSFVACYTVPQSGHQWCSSAALRCILLFWSIPHAPSKVLCLPRTWSSRQVAASQVTTWSSFWTPLVSCRTNYKCNTYYIYIHIHIHPGGSVTGVRKWSKLLRPHSEERVFAFKPIKKKVRLLWEWQPFHHFSLKKGNRNFFSHWRS